MTIQRVVDLLKNEKQEKLPCRFPCRAIMVRNVAKYCELLSELKRISDIRVIKSSELFSSTDVMPKYENLQAPIYRDEWVILTGVSEYLRLFSKKEVTDRRFSALWGYKTSGSSMGRIIIPLWGCEAQWFDSALNLNADSRQQDYFYDCIDSSSPEQYLNLSVLSGIFEQYADRLQISQGPLFLGLQSYFEYWENPISENMQLMLLTKRINGISSVSGKINIHVVKDILSFIKENLSGSSMLSRQNCSDDMQCILFEHALNKEHIDNAVLNILNISQFVDSDAMSKWAMYSATDREFVKLWMMLHPTDSYLNHCFSIAQSTENISQIICHEIFNVRLNRPAWVGEYKTLSKAMKLTLDDEYFSELDKIDDYGARIDFISGTTRGERIYLLRMMGKWMRDDFQEALSDGRLKIIYPELVSYLSSDMGILKDELGDYLASYKKYKIENILPNDEDVFFNGINTDLYDYRYSVLSDFTDDDTVILWVDALGIEWLSLLYWSISNRCNATISSIFVTQATLPTETCFNEQWKSMDVPYEKLDKLDKLAHKGVVDEPDYYSCVEEQLSFITTDVTTRINKLMKQYHRVIITGDHGTSRLAARFFHIRDGVPVPKDAVVCSHGRYCELPSKSSFPLRGIRTVEKQEGKKYMVFENYDHFKQSGFAAGADNENAIYGEVHGGATPEEILVPVIVIDSKEQVALRGEWSKTSVKIFKKKVELEIRFNKTVSDLKVKISRNLANTVKSSDGKKWTVIFEKFVQSTNKATYSVDVIANGYILVMPDITITSPLGSGIGDLP